MKALIVFLAFVSGVSQADENLFGYVKGSETLPKGSRELYEILTHRSDKGTGTYRALDAITEVEYGVTDRFTVGAGLEMLAIKISDLTIDGYIPKDIDRDLSLSGSELSFKYNFLSPAKDDFGLSVYFNLEYSWLDKHSGQRKDTTSGDLQLIGQKYFLEGEMIWVGNFGFEATYAKRYYIEGLPAGFEWPTSPEMEIELKGGTGLSYRFLPKWFIGAEAQYESEYETEVGQERWTLFAGPTAHYGSETWWATLTYFPQIKGGGMKYPNQDDQDKHLIEKTVQEVRLKLGYNF